MPQARLSELPDGQPFCGLEADGSDWEVSDGVLFSVLSSLLLWSLIVAGLHATLT